MTQATLDEAMRERDEALERAERGADAAWKQMAIDAIQHLALHNEEFTADALWIGGLPTPREPRALGAVVLIAVNKGWIKGTDRTRPSVRRHATMIRVWQSLIYSREAQ